MKSYKSSTLLCCCHAEVTSSTIPASAGTLGSRVKACAGYSAPLTLKEEVAGCCDAMWLGPAKAELKASESLNAEVE